MRSTTRWLAVGLVLAGSCAALYHGRAQLFDMRDADAAFRSGEGTSAPGRPSAAYLAAMAGTIPPAYGLTPAWSSPNHASLLATGNFGGGPGTDLAALGQLPENVGQFPSNYEYSIFLYVQGNGGALQPPVSIPLPGDVIGTLAIGLEPGDFNNDGRTDLVLTVSENPALYLLLSNALGEYEWRRDDWSNLPPRVGGKVADFDGDGHLDVVTSAGLDSDWWQPAYPNKHQFYFGDGLGNFTRHRADDAKGQAYTLAVGNFDNDGIRDFAETTYGVDFQRHARVHRNDGSGAFLAPVTLDGREDDYPELLDGADFTGDTVDDVLLSDGAHILVHKNLPDGSLQRIATRFGAWTWQHTRIADLDGNGYPDLVHPHDGGSSAWVYLQDEHGLRHAKTFQVFAGPAFQNMVQSLAIADFNGDGIKDVAVGTPRQGTHVLHGSLTPYAGAGDVPGAPTVGTPTVQAGSSAPFWRANVGVGPPASNGGEPITGYSVFSVPSGAMDLDAGTMATTHRLNSLDDNTSYTFYARAHNAAGLGPPSALSPTLVLGVPENPERAPKLRVEWLNEVERDIDAYPWEVTVRLDRPAPPGGVTFDISASSGTATAGQDFALAAPGTVTIPEGLMAAPIMLTMIGDLLDEPDETFTVHMTNVVGADAASYSETLTIHDDDDPGLRIAIKGARVQEGNAGEQTAHATVILSQPHTAPLTVEVSSFCYMCDYYDNIVDHERFFRQAYVIPAGQTSLQVPVKFDGDTRFENDEFIDVYLESASAGMFAYDNQSRIYMLNDDPAPTLSISDATVVEGDQGQVSMTFTASLSAPMQRQVEFTLRTQDGSAKEGSDYVARYSAAIAIPPGETSATFVVQGVGDVAAEPDESFSVLLEDVSGVAVSDATGSGTLQNDDLPNGLYVDNTQRLEGNSLIQGMAFKVRLSEPSAQAVSFHFRAMPGTASPEDDYAPLPAQEVVILPGHTVVDISWPFFGDTRVELDETFVGEVSNVVGATVVKGQGLARIINDDKPTLAIADATVTEPAEGQQVSAFFLVTLSEPTSTPVAFEASIVPVTTEAGYDHAYAPRPYEYFSSTPPPTKFTIDAGRTSKLVEVWVFGNDVPEPTETYTVQITSPTGATITDGSALGTILDTDGQAAPASKAPRRNPRGVGVRRLRN